MSLQTIAGAIEYKFASDGTELPAGEFLGYGAVFGNTDSHGDIIQPGAFKRTLTTRAAEGRRIPMHVMHGVFGGDGLPIGVWKAVSEDDRGLRVHGKISGMSTEAGKLNWERLQDGAYGGMSIGYRPAENGAKKIEGKRHLTDINLFEISLVDDPSNALARIDEQKRAHFVELITPDSASAATSIAACMKLHADCLAGDDVPTADERNAIMRHLQEAYSSLKQSKPPAQAEGRDFSEIKTAFEFLKSLKLSA